MRIRAFSSSVLLMALALPAVVASTASAQSATTVPASQLIQAADLNNILASADPSPKPLILQVGSHIFFDEAHITGSQYAGPGSQPAGLALLEKAVASLPKDQFIVLYCGCCPWNRCPNVGPAWKRLAGLGYTNVKVLYIAKNFGDDWVSKGYPTQK
jgi:thiosulfate/3-mercaptopyruvate sulfurtransferase